MNDWYNTNEYRSYPFIENHTSSNLPKCEIVDCRFFLKNVNNTTVYLKSREESTESITYTFGTSDIDVNPNFTVPRNKEYKVVWKYENDWYGFCAFGDTTTVLESS